MRELALARSGHWDVESSAKTFGVLAEAELASPHVVGVPSARMKIFLLMAKIPIAISFLLNVFLDNARILMATFDLKMRRDAKHIRFL